MTTGTRTHHQVTNQIQTLLLIITMAGLLGLLGFVLGGMAGVKLAMIVAALGIAFTPAVSSAFVMARIGASPMDPGQFPKLYAITGHLARRAGLDQSPKLYYLPSKQPNAFAMGNRQESGIGITHGLLSSLNTREMAGILSHEITHIRHNDTQVMAMSAVFNRLIGFLSITGQVMLIICLPLILTGMIELSLMILVVLAFAPWLSMFLFQALSRTREFEADLGSVTLLNDPGALASALVKVDAWQRSALGRFVPYFRRPDPVFMGHPPTKERIRRLRESSPSSHRPGIQDGGRILVI